MHVFLLGPKNIGKSTIIKKVIATLTTEQKIKVGGFSTYPGIGDDMDIYISAFNDTRKYEIKNKVAKRNIYGATGIPDVFNSLGMSILQNSKSDLICMDELGFLEQDAPLFQNIILKCLGEDIPILGVIKDTPIFWLNSIKYHPNVELIPITLENRNTIVPLIVKKLKRAVKK